MQFNKLECLKKYAFWIVFFQMEASIIFCLYSQELRMDITINKLNLCYNICFLFFKPNTLFTLIFSSKNQIRNYFFIIILILFFVYQSFSSIICISITVFHFRNDKSSINLIQGDGFIESGWNEHPDRLHVKQYQDFTKNYCRNR